MAVIFIDNINHIIANANDLLLSSLFNYFFKTLYFTRFSAVCEGSSPGRGGDYKFEPESPQ